MGRGQLYPEEPHLHANVIMNLKAMDINAEVSWGRGVHS